MDAPDHGEERAEAERLREVARLLRAAAGPDGFLPFDRFQSIALYAPEVGYYRAAGRRLGVPGDFYTAAHVHPMFGEALSDRLAREWRDLGSPTSLRIVEVGAGDGTLADAVLGGLETALPPTVRCEYVVVELSPPLRERALERLAPRAPRWDVRVASSLGSDGPFEGIVVANELLDALPARRLVRAGGRWAELGVRALDDRFVGAEGPLRPVAGPPLPEDVPDGSVIEFSPGAEGFLRELSDHLTRGLAVLIDYGAEEAELLQGRPGGTLQAVRAHRPIDDPLRSPGSADLSTFVNFTRVRAAAAACGLRTVYYGSQAEALGRWGLPTRLDRAVAEAKDSATEVKVRLAAKSLLFGFSTFRVLELSPPSGATAT